MLRLLVLDEDVVFAERLTSFIRTSEFCLCRCPQVLYF